MISKSQLTDNNTITNKNDINKEVNDEDYHSYIIKDIKNKASTKLSGILSSRNNIMNYNKSLEDNNFFILNTLNENKDSNDNVNKKINSARHKDTKANIYSKFMKSNNFSKKKFMIPKRQKSKVFYSYVKSSTTNDKTNIFKSINYNNNINDEGKNNIEDKAFCDSRFTDTGKIKVLYNNNNKLIDIEENNKEDLEMKESGIRIVYNNSLMSNNDSKANINSNTYELMEVNHKKSKSNLMINTISKSNNFIKLSPIQSFLSNNVSSNKISHLYFKGNNKKRASIHQSQKKLLTTKFLCNFNRKQILKEMKGRLKQTSQKKINNVGYFPENKSQKLINIGESTRNNLLYNKNKEEQLINKRKYSSQSCDNQFLHIEDKEKYYLVIKIKDSGVGMDLSNFTNMQNLFHNDILINQNLHKDYNSCNGIGLGMMIVNHICKAMKFDINYSSKIGKGTVVEIRIPVKLKVNSLNNSSDSKESLNLKTNTNNYANDLNNINAINESQNIIIVPNKEINKNSNSNHNQILQIDNLQSYKNSPNKLYNDTYLSNISSARSSVIDENEIVIKNDKLKNKFETTIPTTNLQQRLKNNTNIINNINKNNNLKSILLSNESINIDIKDRISSITELSKSTIKNKYLEDEVCFNIQLLKNNLLSQSNRSESKMPRTLNRKIMLSNLEIERNILEEKHGDSLTIENNSFSFKNYNCSDRSLQTNSNLNSASKSHSYSNMSSIEDDNLMILNKLKFNKKNSDENKTNINQDDKDNKDIYYYNNEYNTNNTNKKYNNYRSFGNFINTKFNNKGKNIININTENLNINNYNNSNNNINTQMTYTINRFGIEIQNSNNNSINNNHHNSVKRDKNPYNTYNNYLDIIPEKNNNNKRKILICDDSKVILDSLYKLLLAIPTIKEKFEILKGTDGISILNNVLEYQSNNLLKLVISDENMELMNGSSALKLIKSMEKGQKIKLETKFVSLTAFEDANTKREIINSGFNEVLIKPASKVKILKVLKEFSII